MQVDLKTSERFDHRENSQIRQLSAEQSLINRADGSAKFSHSSTTVLAAVYGPVEVKLNKEIIDKATVQVNWKSKIGIPGIVEKCYEATVRETMEQIIERALHPRTAFSIILQVLQDDGSLLSCAFNATYMALVDAGVPMNSMLAAVTCAIVRNDSKERVIILDPSLIEQTTAEAVLTFVFRSCNLNEVLACATSGSFSREELYACTTLASKASEKIIGFMRVSIERRLASLK